MTSADSFDFTEIAFQLEEGRTSARPIDFITSWIPDLTWSDARSIARISDQLRRDGGDSQIGWKLGWTSEAMRTALGIDRPNWGTLWDTQVAEAQLSLAHFIHPKVEPELVWRSPVDLTSDVDAAEVARHGGEWALGIEVVDPRFPSFDFQALDNTADNSSSAAIRLGAFAPLDGDPADVLITFSNGEDQVTGAGSQAMGSPWEAVAWLVRSLAEEELSVHRGDIVFTGGLTAPFDAAAGSTYRLSAPGLGNTTLRFT